MTANIPDHDLPGALTAFAESLTARQDAFQRTLETKMSRYDAQIDRLARKTASRPPLSTTADPGDSLHEKAFNSFVRQGDDAPMRGLRLEGKAMSTAVAADGAALIAPRTADRISARLQMIGSLRSVATVAQIEAGTYETVIDTSDAAAQWVDETTASAETTTPQLARISIPLHAVRAEPRASQRLLEDSVFDVEGWLSEQIAKEFMRTEAAAFISGDGASKPKGFLSHPIIANASWSWGNIGYAPSGAAGAFAPTNPGDALIDLVYALPAGYRANATFVMNSKTAGAVRKIKDNDGRYLWTEGMVEGQPARLLGYPVLICEDMPDIAAGAHAIAFGDFAAGYTIAERPDMRMLRDPFSASPYVIFRTIKRVGGDVTDFSAIKVMKFAAS